MNLNQQRWVYAIFALASVVILLCCAAPRPLLRNPSASQPPGPAATKAGGLSAESARPAPVRPMPIRPQPPQWLAAPPQAGRQGFARAVALSGDTAVITAPGATLPGRASVGAAYVYRNTGSSFELQQVLVAPTDRAGESFGQAVALSGSQLAIGAFYSDIHITDIDASMWSQGEVYIFEQHANDWRYKEQLASRLPPQPSGVATARSASPFGSKLAMNQNRLVISGRNDEEMPMIFSHSSTGWQYQHTLTFVDRKMRILPGGPSIITKGEFIFVGNLEHILSFGSDYHRLERFEQDSVCEFAVTGSEWKMSGCLNEDHDVDAPHAGVGASVALSKDLLAVGIPRLRTDGKLEPGLVRILAREETHWAWQVDLQAPAPHGHSGDEFGRTVALAGDRLIVGNRDSDPVSSQAFVFLRRAGKWELEGTYSLDLPTGAGSAERDKGPAPRYLDTTLSTDGTTLILGAAQVTPAIAAAQERALIVRFPVAP